MSASSFSVAAAAAAVPVLLGAAELACKAGSCSFRFLFLAGDAPTFTPLLRHQQRCPHVLAELRASFDREQREVEADKQRVAAREASLRQRQQQLLGITQSPREDRQQPRMDDEAKGDSVSSLAATQRSDPPSAPAAAASSPAQLTPLKRAREDGQSQRRADPASAVHGAADEDGDEEDAEMSLPASKAPRVTHSAHASSSTAATSAAASASPSVSRSRIPKAAAAASSSSSPAVTSSASSSRRQMSSAAAASSTSASAAASSAAAPRRFLDADDDEEDTLTEEEEEDSTAQRSAPAAAAASARATSGRRRSSKARRGVKHRRRGSADLLESAAAASSVGSSAWPLAVRRPRAERFATLNSKETQLWNLTDMTLKYGGEPLPVFELNGWHLVSFEQLCPRMVEHGLLPKAIPVSKYQDDAQLSPALRMLYFFLDNHQRFEDILAAEGVTARNHYLPLRPDVALVSVDGRPLAPFLELRVAIQTLCEHAYLEPEEREPLDDEFNLLYAACEPILFAPPQFPVNESAPNCNDW